MEDKLTKDIVCREIERNYEALAINADKQLQEKISNQLDSSGIMYRIFSRKKALKSIVAKMNKKAEAKYIPNKQRMQDLVGVRIVLYFKDDIDICIEILSSLFTIVGQEYDQPDEKTFQPQRINFVYRVPDDIDYITAENSNICLIDNTFEVQIRTIFSEGWHEVEHDIRYKYEGFWKQENGLSRELNGLLAVLETCDNGIIGVCDRLAYNSYKKKAWEAMIRNHFRLHLSGDPVSEEIVHIMDDDLDFCKYIFRYDRRDLILLLKETKLPCNCDNIVFIINEVRDEPLLGIKKITPEPVARKIRNANRKTNEKRS